MDIRFLFQDCMLVIILLSVQQGICQDDDYEDGPAFGRCPWIRNSLKNGRVRYRYKGRVAKFLCDSGYELAGKRSSTCVRGQWSNPLPVCVSRGCNRVPSIPNGRVTEMYRGALLVYDCNPGYTLVGDSSIHCDGRRWNTTTPICAVSTPDPETQCDFESFDLCGWSHDPTHDFDWRRNQFATPSGHVGTGPSFDHTFGENKAGYYLYIEASSPRKQNDVARLFSPVFPAFESGGCFIFWYHMFGATTGGIKVYLKPESHVFGELTPTWEKFGDQGNQWIRGNISVPVFHENFQIVIEGIRGASYVGDSAIDDVLLSKLDCVSAENITEVETEDTAESCRGRCRGIDSSGFCGCNENCHAAENCCSDYTTLCSEGNETLVQTSDEPLPGDYYGKTTIPATITILPAETDEVKVSTLSSLPSQSLSQSSIPTSPYTHTSNEQPITVLISTTMSPSTTRIVNPSPSPSLTTSSTSTSSTTSLTKTSPATSSTKSSSTASSMKTTSTTKPSTPIKIVTVLPTTTISTTTTDIPKPITVISSSTPTTKSSISSTFSSKPSPAFEITSSRMISSSSTTTVISTSSTEKTTKAQETFKSSDSPTTTSKIFTITTPLSSSTSTMSSIKSTNNPVLYSNRTTLVSISTSTDTTSTSSNSDIPSSSTPRYNLRPRKTTFSTTYSTISSALFSSTKTTPMKTEKTTVLPILSTTNQNRKWFNFTVFSASTTVSTTKKTTTVPYMAQTKTQKETEATTFAYRNPKLTTSDLPIRADSHEMVSSKAEPAKQSSSSAIVITLVVITIICISAGLFYYIRKYRGKRQSKLDDDSEMRFLPESDYMEYSDASALDKILVK